jgi:hypothetical protein
LNNIHDIIDSEVFRGELEQRLLIEKQYLSQEFLQIEDDQERLELLGKFNNKYKELIKKNSQRKWSRFKCSLSI